MNEIVINKPKGFEVKLSKDWIKNTTLTNFWSDSDNIEK